jgi:hypothetical protein
MHKIIAATTVAVVGFCSAVAMAASAPASAPIMMNQGATYECRVVNTSDKSISSVIIDSVQNGGGVSASTGCEPLPTGQVCVLSSSAASPGFRWCRLTVVGSSKPLRGTFCNTSTNACTPLQ